MPIEQVLWKIGEVPERLMGSSLDDENQLEELICTDIRILNEQWLLIGRQVPTAYNKLIDLLAIDAAGSLIIIELKKSKTPRDIVAQILDYATWVQTIDSTTIADIYREFSKKHAHTEKSIDLEFRTKFGYQLREEELNNSHQMVIVSSSLDSSSERIVKYLSDSGVPINAVFFRVFKDGPIRYLSRAWFIDPAETQEGAAPKKTTEPWNHEFYVSFGHNQGRSWEDARKYGFISGGGGKWYSQTLYLLEKDDHVWVNIPQEGYVGVGIVEAPAVKVDEFMVQTEDGEVPLLDAPIKADYHKKWIDDEDKAEYVVRVKWIRELSINKAVSEIGFFGNQNTVCRPTTPKWNHTVERLKEILKIKESELGR